MVAMYPGSVDIACLSGIVLMRLMDNWVKTCDIAIDATFPQTNILHIQSTCTAHLDMTKVATAAGDIMIFDIRYSTIELGLSRKGGKITIDNMITRICEHYSCIHSQ